ncbi:MAG: hypothetical protein A4E64_00590 [Syntrophorhabdus sp. PtaU1.Bin058]|nr:MAG: hypothetical protein A4E64_00590 [Syntrophorhabdus sp. PtaU1.Bin058]
MPVGGKYTAVSNPRDINGRVAFKAEQIKEQFVINERGEKIPGDYEQVSVPQNIHGRIAFWARQGRKYFIVNESGVRDGREYDEVYRLKPLPEGRAYVIAKNDHAYIKDILDDAFFTDSGP